MTIARVHGEPSQRALAGIRAIRDHLLKVDLDLESLPSMAPEAIASAIRGCDPDPQWRVRILRGMTLVALFDGAPSQECLQLLNQTAAGPAAGVSGSGRDSDPARRNLLAVTTAKDLSGRRRSRRKTGKKPAKSLERGIPKERTAVVD